MKISISSRNAAPINIDFTTQSILLRTDTDGRINKKLLFYLTYDAHPFTSSMFAYAGFEMNLNQENPTYYFKVNDCFESHTTKKLPEPLPAPDQNGYWIFRIEAYRFQGQKICCNNEMILSLQPSWRECSSNFWDRNWLHQKTGIRFGYLPSMHKFSTTRPARYISVCLWSLCCLPYRRKVIRLKRCWWSLAW